MMAKVVSSKDFREEIKSGVVLVDFYADWCGPCKMVAPILDELSEEFEGKAKIVKVNVDKNMDIAQKYVITNIPALLIFKEGEEVDRKIGFTPKAELKEKIEQFL